MPRHTIRLFFISLGFLTNAHICRAEETNAGNRQGKTAYGALEVIGLTMMPVSGLRGGYFINPGLTAELGFASGGAKIGDFETKKTIIEAKGKYFIGDSFYVDGGIGHEMWTTTYPVYTSATSFETKTLNGKVTNTGLELHLGNQWQWTGFTLGCDWVGYFLSLSSSYSLSSDSGVDTGDKTRREDDLKKSLGGSSAHLVRFYLGWAF